MAYVEPGDAKDASDELKRLRLIEQAARHYRFAGTPASRAFLKRRGWVLGDRGLWHPPQGSPADGPKSDLVALAIELELALGCHQ